MEEAPENGKESLHSAHANGMHEYAAVSTLDSTAFNGWILANDKLYRASQEEVMT
jgi:hypothetical protein